MEFKDFGNLVKSKLSHCLLEMKKKTQIKFDIYQKSVHCGLVNKPKPQNNQIVAVIWVSSLFNSNQSVSF